MRRVRPGGARLPVGRVAYAGRWRGGDHPRRALGGIVGVACAVGRTCEQIAVVQAFQACRVGRT